jgi:hypothetical protein
VDDDFSRVHGKRGFQLEEKAEFAHSKGSRDNDNFKVNDEFKLHDRKYEHFDQNPNYGSLMQLDCIDPPTSRPSCRKLSANH